MKINTKKLQRRGTECMEEMAALFACMGKVGLANIDEGCAKERAALADCSELLAKKGRRRSSINFHLQRLSRALK